MQGGDAYVGFGTNAPQVMTEIEAAVGGITRALGQLRSTGINQPLLGSEISTRPIEAAESHFIALRRDIKAALDEYQRLKAAMAAGAPRQANPLPFSRVFGTATEAGIVQQHLPRLARTFQPFTERLDDKSRQQFVQALIDNTLEQAKRELAAGGKRTYTPRQREVAEAARRLSPDLEATFAGQSGLTGAAVSQQDVRRRADLYAQARDYEREITRATAENNRRLREAVRRQKDLGAELNREAQRETYRAIKAPGSGAEVGRGFARVSGAGPGGADEYFRLTRQGAELLQTDRARDQAAEALGRKRNTEEGQLRRIQEQTARLIAQERERAALAQLHADPNVLFSRTRRFAQDQVGALFDVNARTERARQLDPVRDPEQYLRAQQAITREAERQVRQRALGDLRVQEQLGGATFAGRYAQDQRGALYEVSNLEARRLHHAEELRRAQAAVTKEYSNQAQEILRQHGREQPRPASVGEAFFGGLTSRGFSTRPKRADIDEAMIGLAGTAGNVVKYSALYSGLFAATTAASDTLQETKDMVDSITDLTAAMDEAGPPTQSFINNLSNIAALSGGNVGQAADIAARGIRVFREEVDAGGISAEKLGADLNTAATNLSIIGDVDIQTVGKDIAAATKGFDLGARGFLQVADAVAAARESFGGDINDIARAVASISGVMSEAGFSVAETAQLISGISAETGETGQTIATRVARMVDTLSGSTGQRLADELGIDATLNARQKMEAFVRELPKQAADVQDRIKGELAGIGGAREVEALFGPGFLNRALTEAQDSVGKSAELAARRLNDLTGLLRRIGGEISELQTQLVQTDIFAPFGAGLKIAERFLTVLTEILKKYNTITDAIPDIGEKLGGPFKAIPQPGTLIGAGLSTLAVGAVVRRVGGDEGARGLLPGARGRAVTAEIVEATSALAGTMHAEERVRLAHVAALQGANRAQVAAILAGTPVAGRAAAGAAAATGYGAIGAAGVAGISRTAAGVFNLPSKAMAALGAGFAALASPAVLLTGAIVGTTYAVGSAIEAHEKYRLALDEVIKSTDRPMGVTPQAKRAEAEEIAKAVDAAFQTLEGAGAYLALTAKFLTPGATFLDRGTIAEPFNREIGDAARAVATRRAAADAQEKALADAARIGSADILGLVTERLDDTATAGDRVTATLNYLRDGGHSTADSVRILSGAIRQLGNQATTAAERSKVLETEVALHDLNVSRLPEGDFGAGRLTELRRHRDVLVGLQRVDPTNPDLIKKIADANQAIVDIELQGLERTRKAALSSGQSVRQHAATERASLDQQLNTVVSGGGSAEQLAEVIETFGSMGIASARAYLARMRNTLQALNKQIAAERALVTAAAVPMIGPVVPGRERPMINPQTGNVALPMIGPVLPGRERPYIDTKTGKQLPAGAQKRLTAAEQQAKQIADMIKAIEGAVNAAMGAVSDAAQLTSEQINALSAQANVSPGNSLGQAQAAVNVALANLHAAAKKGTRSPEYIAALREYNQAVYNVSQVKAADADTLVQLAAARTGGPLAAAQGQLRAATNQLRRATGPIERRQALLAIEQARDAQRQAYLDHAAVLDQLTGDLTNPVEQAQDALLAARRKLATSRPGDRAQNQLDVRQAEANLERTRLQQRLSDVQTNYDLGRISFAAYMRYLNSEHDRMVRIKKRTYDQQQYLNDIDRAIKGANDQMQGQWNLGDIKIPTVYQVRRAVGGDGAYQMPRVSPVNTVTNNIQIDGADIATVTRVLNQILGPGAIVNSTHLRKS